LSFACIMTSLAVFLYFELDLYRATTSEAAVVAVRRTIAISHVIIACCLVFIPAYTKVRFPSGLRGVYWGGLAILFVINLMAPYGLWFSGPPQLVHAMVHGEPYNTVIPPPMGFPQYVDTAYYMSLLAVALGCAIKQVRRGERERGWTLMIAL